MIRKFLSVSLLAGTLAAISLSLSACTTDSDSDDEIDMALLQNEWKVSAVTVDVAIPGFGANILALFTDCDKSVVLKFNADGTYTRTPDPDECEDSEEVADATSSGTYTVSGNTLTVDEAGVDEDYVFTVTELSATSVTWTEAIPVDEFDDNTARVMTSTYTAL